MKKFIILFLIICGSTIVNSQILIDDVDLSYQSEINDNLHGFNTTGLFQHCLCEPGTISSDYCFDAFAKLNPKVLRFPSGAERKFMNLLGDSDFNVEYENINGYGFIAQEVLEYLLEEFGCDNFNECYQSLLIPDPDASFIPGFNNAFDEWLGGYIPIDILTDLLTEYGCANFNQCYQNNVGDLTFEPGFNANCFEWLSEYGFPVEPYDAISLPNISSELTRQLSNNHTQYIDRFITLVEELAFRDIYPEIIYVADIHNSSVAQNVEIIEYLKDNDVNIVGIELGNEEYDEFETASDYIETIKPFVIEFRTNPSTTDIKLGINAAPAGDMLYHDEFIIPSELRRTAYNDWNSTIGDFSGYVDYPLIDPFDALIVHIYLDEKFLAETMDALSDYFTPTPNVEVTMTPTFSPLHSALSYGKSDFANYLFDFHKSFEGISGLVNYYSSYFDLDDPLNNNNIWITEWNTKTGIYAGSNDVDIRNTFIHSSLIFLWQLRNMSIDSEDLLNLSSLEYNTLQNSIGDYSCVIGTIKENDAADTDPSPSNDYYFDNEFRLRAHYYAMLYTSVISKRDLKKIQLDYYDPFIDNHWFNLFAFIPESLDTLYIYFNNNANSVGLTLPNNIFICSDGSCVENPLDYNLKSTKVVEYIDARQLYSTAGAAPIYDQNIFYNPTTVDPEFDLIGLKTTFTGEGFIVPKYSLGVIKCPVSICEFDCRKEQEMINSSIQLVKNPSDGHFGIKTSTEIIGATLNIANSYGQSVYNSKVDLYTQSIFDVNQTSLSKGIYFVSIFSEDLCYSEKLIIQ